MSKPLDFFKYDSGALTCEGLKISEIVANHGSPLYIYSASAFLEPLRELQEGLKGIDSTICFAQKANSNLSILKLIASAGAGMDLVTGGELFRAERAGVAPDKIVFSGVAKTADEMKAALQFKAKGIFSFNVESAPELLRLNETARSLGKRARVALRFNPDVDPKTHPYISTGLKKNKFGMEEKEILEIVKNAKTYSNIEFQGLSIHIGSQLTSLSPLEDAFKKLKALAEKLSQILNRPLSYLDLGGGVGITYLKEKAPPLRSYTALIRKHFEKFTQTHGMKILIEPGRAISGNSGILVTQVLYRKIRKGKDFLIVDAGMNDLIRPALYDSYHEIVPLIQKPGQRKKRKVDIVGPVCESADCFARDRLLPETVGEGDYLAILSSGAYGFTMASNYNSRPRPAEILVQQGAADVIRKRETFEDLVRGELHFR